MPGFAFKKKGKKKKPLFGDDDAPKMPSLSKFLGGEPAATAHPAAAAPPAAAAADDDDLDAFMAGIGQQIVAEKAKPRPPPEEKADIFDDDSDGMEDYKHSGGVSGHGDNSDEEVYAAAKRVDKQVAAADEATKKGKTLEVVDHDSMCYDDFQRHFYKPSKQITDMTDEEVRKYKEELDLSVTWVTGGAVPRPLKAFSDARFDAVISKAILKQGFEKPTGVQAQAWPILLSGRDIIGIAKTGSGKTAAFILPGLVQLMAQPELKKNDGPIMVVLAPTRELAKQIYDETKKFARGYNLQIGGIFGGMSKFEQFKVLKNGVEIVVATPGRMIELMKMKATNLARVTYLVLDEADRMLDMGFEAQVRSIAQQIRPNRQTAMFSATFKRSVEGLARDLMRDPVRITIGSVGQSNMDIKQVVEVVKDEEAKWMWLTDHIEEVLDQGQVLIFRGSRDNCDAMASRLRLAAFKCNSLHGEKDQRERDDIMTAFKSGMAPILIATDVASRGLDIRGIKNVINFDVARDMDSHVHRIGRTGRAGDKGTAYTLIEKDNQKDQRFAGDLVRNLKQSGNEVPKVLVSCAMKDGRFKARLEREGGMDCGNLPAGMFRGQRATGDVAGLGFDDGGKKKKKGKGGGGGGGSSAPLVPATQTRVGGFVMASTAESFDAVPCGLNPSRKVAKAADSFMSGLSAGLTPAASKPAMAAQFAVGDVVAISGIQGRPELNGQCGSITGPAPNGRFMVCLQTSGETVSLKPTNFTAVEQGPPAKKSRWGS